jgi:ribosomal-protein-alanine N-acetyltransferase
MFADACIEASRVLLRPFTSDDLEAFTTIASQEEVLEFLPESDRMSPTEMKATLEWLIWCYHENTPDLIRKFTLPVILKRTGDIVGWCGIGPLEFDESETELYFVISHEHWGKGLATESARALLGYVFAELRLPRVVAVVHPANRASVRVVEKLGMRAERSVEGLPEAHRHYEGHTLYALEAGDCTETADTLD